MADTAVPPSSEPVRKRTRTRKSDASANDAAEAERKLARAAQSAQRLAQLSDAARDDRTSDLFPDDPTPALVRAMQVDSRQATLAGFELPETVRIAVEAAQRADAPRRAAGVARERAAAAYAPGEAAAPPSAGLAALDLPDAVEHEHAAHAPETLAPDAAPADDPALDHARAAAFADTVDALHSVLTEQRRASAEYARRMKRVVAAVLALALAALVCAIVALAMAARAGSEANARVQRLEQRVDQQSQDQQAALAGLQQRLAAVTANAQAAAAAAAARAAATPARPARPAAAAAAAKKRAAPPPRHNTRPRPKRPPTPA